MSDLPTPITREEQFLNGIAQGDTSNLPTPVGREEKYLDYIARNGGGGGGGTTNYNALDNKPQIAGTTLQGDKSLADLGIASASDVATALAGKVDKVAGKGLSTNDYDNTEKGKVADNTAAIEAMVNVNGAKNWALLEPESESKDGITFTCTDGKSLTLSGTASDNTGKSYNLETPITGNVIVTLEQTANKVTLSYNDGTDWHTLPADGKVNGTITQVGFNIVSGTVINETVYLMIRDARITDPTYAPYAMTNEQLTRAVDRGSVSVTTDGVKTYAQILSDLHSLIDISKISPITTKFVRIWGNTDFYYIPLVYKNNTDHLQFCGVAILYNNEIHNDIFSFLVQDNIYTYKEVVVAGSGNTLTDRSSEIPPSGVVFTVYY